MTEIYVDGDACPVREEIYRVAARLRLNVFVVSNGSRPIRSPDTPNVRMVLVSDSADAADDWIAERISAVDVCVTSDIPLASRRLETPFYPCTPFRPQSGDSAAETPGIFELIAAVRARMRRVGRSGDHSSGFGSTAARRTASLTDNAAAVL